MGMLLPWSGNYIYAPLEVTNVTNRNAQSYRKCGNIVSTIMQVFTTIYLAETLRANIECVEETEGLDQEQPGVVEFKQALRKRIAMLENRGFYEDGDGFDD